MTHQGQLKIHHVGELVLTRILHHAITQKDDRSLEYYVAIKRFHGSTRFQLQRGSLLQAIAQPGCDLVSSTASINLSHEKYKLDPSRVGCAVFMQYQFVFPIEVKLEETLYGRDQFMRQAIGARPTAILSPTQKKQRVHGKVPALLEYGNDLSVSEFGTEYRYAGRWGLCLREAQAERLAKESLDIGRWECPNEVRARKLTEESKLTLPTKRLAVFFSFERVVRAYSDQFERIYNEIIPNPKIALRSLLATTT